MGFARKRQRFFNTYIGQDYQGIRHYNWIGGDKSWFAEFVNSRFEGRDLSRLSFVSVFGSLKTFWFHRKEKKVFWTGENLDRYHKYKKKLPVALSLGFEDKDSSDYLRFPIWLLYLFSPKDTAEDIRKKIYSITEQKYLKTEFATLVARHDPGHLRQEIVSKLSELAPVSSAGAFMHNDDRLWKVYQNNKIQYLSQFRFSICPENSDASGYVTEKLFEAFLARAIPIYWGAEGRPEEGRINPRAVLFWEKGCQNTALLEQIYELNASSKEFQHFLENNPFLPSFSDYVVERFEKLEKKLSELL